MVSVRRAGSLGGVRCSVPSHYGVSTSCLLKDYTFDSMV